MSLRSSGPRSRRRPSPGEGLDQFQRRREADAALADQCSRLDLCTLGAAAAREADADFMTAEQRMLVLCRGMLLVDELALPAAVQGAIGAKIIEERVAPEDAAVFQQHHAGLPTGDAVQHPDVDRVEPADDAAFADRPRRRDVVIAKRRHDRAEHRSDVFDNGPREVPDVALRLATYADRD